MTSYGDEGWTFGILVGSTEWLTVYGSRWKAPVLHGTPEDAYAEMDEWAVGKTLDVIRDLTIARVRMVFHGGVGSGRAFRILERYEVPA